MLSEINQTKTEIPYDLTNLWNLKTEQKRAHRYKIGRASCRERV